MNMIRQSIYHELNFKDSIYNLNNQFKKFGFLKSDIELIVFKMVLLQ